MLSPTTISFVVLSLLAGCWLAMRERAVQLDGLQPYHVGTYQRDRRKARFYFLSGWAGIAATFLAMGVLLVVASALFVSTSVKNWTTGVAYGVGLWGVLILAMIWSQVGQRVSEPNSDGNSLLPVPVKEKNREKSDRR